MPPASQHWLDAPLTEPYRWTMLGAIALSAWYWLAKSKRDPALLPVYIGALGGAFLGAKLAYLFAEGWIDWSMPERWLRLFAGKSVIGGLLGGYAGVELMKFFTGYKKYTSDLFALVVPLGIALGRVGCWLQGCCLGKPTTLHLIAARDKLGNERWPASLVELAFQLVIFAVFLVLRRNATFTGRLIFVYFAAYGVFRFFHEFMRDTPPLVAGITGYQILALITAATGVGMFIKRGRETAHSCAA
ncbi:MAG: prolipoprotein diacylglyceryl transferase [Verrucomicrobia bacterium]|nr:prolipoprotein diacylglyceryl transferase [Verrucomicrobiota bacterium]